MRDHPGRLVNDEQIVVFVDDVERNRFRLCHQYRRLRNLELEHVAGFELPAWFYGAAVDEDFAAPRALGYKGARGPAKKGDEDVGAFPGLFSGDDV